MEFSVAWARRLNGLSPEARRRLGALRSQTRQTGGKLGQGADFRVYESFTPGRGRTVTKTLIPEALPERDQVMAAVKKSWGEAEASPAGKFAALPAGWHKAGYVQDRMLDPQYKSTFRKGYIHPERKERVVGSRFAEKISSGFDRGRGAAYNMPMGANDSSLTIRSRGTYERLRRKVQIDAHNIMLDPRKRRLVLTDPLGWQSSSTQIGALTPGPAVR